MSMIWTPDRRIIAPNRRVWTPRSRQLGFVCLPGGGLGSVGPAGGGGGGGISYIGSASGTTSATLPAHQAGDVIIGFAYANSSSSNVPTLPAGWTNIDSGLGGVNRFRVGYIVAAGSGTSSGTWTDAQVVVFTVYRGCNASPIGAWAKNVYTDLNLIYPGLTLQNSSGSSWVVGAAGVNENGGDLPDQTPPTGMTLRVTSDTGVRSASLHDTNAGMTAWTQKSVTNSTGYYDWVTYSIELKAA